MNCLKMQPIPPSFCAALSYIVLHGYLWNHGLEHENQDNGHLPLLETILHYASIGGIHAICEQGLVWLITWSSFLSHLTPRSSLCSKAVTVSDNNSSITHKSLYLEGKRWRETYLEPVVSF